MMMTQRKQNFILLNIISLFDSNINFFPLTLLINTREFGKQKERKRDTIGGRMGWKYIEIISTTTEPKSDD